MAFDAAALGAAFVAMPGHKGLLGPQGHGILLCFAQPKPLLCGPAPGSQSVLQDMPEELPGPGSRPERTTFQASRGARGIRYLSAQGVEHIERRERWLAQRLTAQLRAQPRWRCLRRRIRRARRRCCPSAAGIWTANCWRRSLRATASPCVRAALRAGRAPHGRNAGDWHGRLSLSPFNTDAEIARTARVFHEILRADNADYVLKSAGL